MQLVPVPELWVPVPEVHKFRPRFTIPSSTCTIIDTESQDRFLDLANAASQ